MKSYGGLFERIVAPENVQAAMLRAARGKCRRVSVRRFLADGAKHLESLRADLLDGSYRPLPYRQFVILDPKPRRISCADFRDRVVQHAICAVLAPVLERRFIAGNYACRVGKGVHRAIRQAQKFTAQYLYFARVDVRKFYDSVDHVILLARVAAYLREPRLRQLLDVIVRHPFPGQAPGKGLAIGNLTSQWLANFYLDGLDHRMKDQVACTAYVRYMDDVVLWDDSKERLWECMTVMREFLNDALSLTFEEGRAFVAPCTEGVPYLGWRIFPRHMRQLRGSLRRQRRLLALREAQYARGELDEAGLVASARSIAARRSFFGTGERLRGRVDV